MKKKNEPTSVGEGSNAQAASATPEQKEIITSDLANQIGEILKKASAASNAEDIPIIILVDTILVAGYMKNASDIHIEPYEEDTLVRFRIDGILHDMVSIPANLHDLIIMRIKILSRLRTDEHRAAQDGKLRFKVEKEKIDARVSILPVVHGEKVVLRLLSEKAQQYALENLGFNEVQYKIIVQNVDKPWGMILSTGPTGSGKTTTLYSVLKRLNTREVNISTIEDPVEYELKGISQIQINEKTNLTFSNGLRSIVRQDPDIIMVGEIRDEETAKIAINAAMTGHLVLSTFHTNDAPTALPRFLDMGVQPFLVASTVNLIIGQRLVRKLCEQCKQKQAPDERTLKLLTEQLSKELLAKYGLEGGKFEYYSAGHCSACHDTGFQGRLGIYEMLEMNDTIKDLVMEKRSAEEVRNKAIENGMVTMIEDGIQKMIAGLTTLEELLRVVKE